MEAVWHAYCGRYSSIKVGLVKTWYPQTEARVLKLRRWTKLLLLHYLNRKVTAYTPAIFISGEDEEAEVNLFGSFGGKLKYDNWMKKWKTERKWNWGRMHGIFFDGVLLCYFLSVGAGHRCISLYCTIIETK
jgi:hypothetical protein